MASMSERQRQSLEMESIRANALEEEVIFLREQVRLLGHANGEAKAKSARDDAEIVKLGVVIADRERDIDYLKYCLDQVRVLFGLPQTTTEVATIDVAVRSVAERDTTIADLRAVIARKDELALKIGDINGKAENGMNELVRDLNAIIIRQATQIEDLISGIRDFRAGIYSGTPWKVFCVANDLYKKAVACRPES